LLYFGDKDACGTLEQAEHPWYWIEGVPDAALSLDSGVLESRIVAMRYDVT